MNMIQNQEPIFELVSVGGRLKWLSNYGDLLPVVRGGSDDGDDFPATTGAKTYTQEELNTMIGEARRKSRETAANELVKQLGVDDIDKAKALVKAAQEADEKNASELDKATRKLAEAQAKAESADLTVAQINLTNSIEKALIKEGLSVEAAERVRKLVDVQKNDADDIKSAISQLRKEMPTIFTPMVGGMPSSNPGAPPPKDGKPGDPNSIAMQVLHERHPHLKK